MRKLRLDIFAIVLAPYLLLVHRFWFVTDDAYISFRYARNLARGLGLRFNPGEHAPIEGYSNFLWVMICSVFEYFRMDIEFWPMLTSAICGAALLWLVFDTMRRRLDIPTPAAAVATAALGCFPPFAAWSTSGLATMPFALLVFVTFERLVLRKDQAAGVAAGIAALLLALIRLEGFAWVAVILILAAISRKAAGQFKLRPLATCALIAGVGYAAYFYWRYSYYGVLLPNTAYAKAELDWPRLVRGFNYVFSFGLTFLTPFLLAPLSLAALRKGRRATGLVTAAIAWGFPAYAVLVTGDFMTMGRFMIPGLSFAAVLLGWILTDFWGRGAARKAAVFVGGAAVIGLGLIPGWDVHLAPESVRERFRFRFNAEFFHSEYSKWQAQVDNAEDWKRCGVALRSYVDQRQFEDPNPSYVSGGIGAVGYFSDLYIYDRHGLVDPEIARREIAPGAPLRSAGHDKMVTQDYFVRFKPTILRARTCSGKDRSQLINACRYEASAIVHAGLAPPLRLSYVVDFARVPADRPEDEPVYIITWTRIPEGVDYKAAWAEFERRLAAEALQQPPYRQYRRR